MIDTMENLLDELKTCKAHFENEGSCSGCRLSDVNKCKSVVASEIPCGDKMDALIKLVEDTISRQQADQARIAELADERDAMSGRLTAAEDSLEALAVAHDELMNEHNAHINSTDTLAAQLAEAIEQRDAAMKKLDFVTADRERIKAAYGQVLTNTPEHKITAMMDAIYRRVRDKHSIVTYSERIGQAVTTVTVSEAPGTIPCDF